jgi:proton glutamate symport protein
VVVNVAKPGVGVDLGTAGPSVGLELAKTRPSLTSLLEHAIPRSVVDAAATNQALQIVLFSIIFAVGVAGAPTAAKRVMLAVCESLCEVMFRYVAIVMKFAPLGIGGAIAATVGRSGIGVLGRLAMLVLTLYAALVLFVLVVLLPIALACKVPIRRFWHATREPWLVAFSTASSEAALPLALRNMERMGVPRRIASFVLPTGYSFNMDGTSLYLSLAAIFVAQAAGVHMAVSQQVLMMLTLMLTSKGVAAVPRTSLVILSGTLTQFGLPLQGVAVILGVDAFMDMARTSLNLLGNCLATVLMARWDGSFDPDSSAAFVDSPMVAPSPLITTDAA